MKQRQVFISFFMVMTLFIAGCSEEKKTTEEHDHESHAVMNEDIQEETSSPEILPSFLDGKEDTMKTIYAASAQHQELLEYIPCYCGCGDSAGHKSNFNCFVQQKNGEKTTWDDHGTRCGVCLEIAAESIVEYNKGKSIKEIRKTIDEKYNEGYAKPTPTPMPS
ncbi:hypothetical protein VL06_19410 [Rossellomorea marisflavi]|nr:hypothetical protein VL06_19410 [Rossellomorea marisflavi]